MTPARKRLWLGVSAALFALFVGIAVWIMTSEIRGDIFILNEEGHAVILPGAQLTLYRVSASQEETIILKVAKNLDTYFYELRQTAPQINPHLPTDDYVSFLHHAQLLAGMKHCQELRKDITPILLPGYTVR